MEVLIGILLIAGVIWLATRRGAEPKSSQSRTSDRARSTSSRPVDRGVQNSARAGPQAWVPPGQAVTVRGRVLPRGMLYVGSGVQGVSSYGPTEAALIDPELRTDDRSPDVHGSEMGYWPSYAEISPRSRAAYLDWLEAGRPGGAYIGYVFLFFYGIERRVLLDAPRSEEARAELPALISEIERLLELHGDNHSFRGYASSFLSFARLGSGPVDTDTLTAPISHEGWDFPISLRLALVMIVDAV